MGVTGVVITKLDGTARAGYVVGLVRDLGLPVKLVGVGEGLGDLKDFDPREFVDAPRARRGGGAAPRAAPTPRGDPKGRPQQQSAAAAAVLKCGGV